MDEKKREQLRYAPRRPFVWPIILFVLGIFLGRHSAGPPSVLLDSADECPATLPLDPLYRHPLLQNDTRLKAAEQELSEVLHDKLDETDSAVVIVVHNGLTLLEWSHGRIRSNVSAEDDDRKVGPDTIWRVASITKVFTVLEALIQQNQGKISLEDDIREYVEEFRLYDNAKDILPLRALGSHLSGLGRDVLANDLKNFPDPKSVTALSDFETSAAAFCDEGSTDNSNGTKICTKEDLLKAISSRPLSFEPWTRPLYSNTGFNLLGWAVAKAASQKAKGLISQGSELSQYEKSTTLEDLLVKDVFEPLKMKDSSFWVPINKRDNVAVPRKGTPCMIDWDFTSTFNPAGGMYTTANDLAKFINKVILSPNSSILSTQQIREWLSPLYVFPDRKTAVGMPWEISLPSDLVAHPLYAKAGMHPGHTSHILISPDLSFAVISMACGPDSDAGTLASETLRLLTPLFQKRLGEASIEDYAGIYQQNCSGTCKDGCGEVVIEVDAEIKITRLSDCEGEDLFRKFDKKCEKEECFAKLWTTGRDGEFRYRHQHQPSPILVKGLICRAQILEKKGKGCQGTWMGFEKQVIDGWPIDLIRIEDGKVVYKPLGIKAERLPMMDMKEEEKRRFREGMDGLRAWRDEAPLDMEW